MSPTSGVPIDLPEIDRRFDYHKPSGVAVEYHERLRVEAKRFALMLTNLPDGREKALAFTAFEEAIFWANASVAREPSLHAVPPVEVTK